MLGGWSQSLVAPASVEGVQVLERGQNASNVFRGPGMHHIKIKSGHRGPCKTAETPPTMMKSTL